MEKHVIERLRGIEGRVSRLEHIVKSRNERAGVWIFVLFLGGLALGNWIWKNV
jgi:hypothetical protein